MTFVLLGPHSVVISYWASEERGVEADHQSETFECLGGHAFHENGNDSVRQEPTLDWGSAYLHIPVHRMF